MPVQHHPAQVKILLKGYFVWLNQERNTFKASSTVTLIQDGKVNILVDTENHEVEKKLLGALKKVKLKAELIDYVIITHHHPDHVANNHLFKNAIFTDFLTSYQKNKFAIDYDIVNQGKNIISPNVYVIPTPGHSLDGCSVIIQTSKGLVAVCGDLFVAKQAEKNVLIQDAKEALASRKKIIALADYVVPGHGGMFEVVK